MPIADTTWPTSAAGARMAAPVPTFGLLVAPIGPIRAGIGPISAGISLRDPDTILMDPDIILGTGQIPRATTDLLRSSCRCAFRRPRAKPQPPP